MVSKDYEDKIIEETKRVVKLFLETNESDIELAKKTGISSSTIGRRLTNKGRILAAFPENGEEVYETIMNKRKENSMRGKILGGQASMLNYGNVDTLQTDASTKPKLRLEILSKSEEKQYKILIHMALTYRAKLPLLSELFQIDEKEMLEKLLTYAGTSYKSLLYLFYHDLSDQDLACINVIAFYKDLINAIKSKDKEIQRIVISRIDDSQANEVIKGRIPGGKLGAQNIEIILRYQLKYALTQEATCHIFAINRRNYQSCFADLLRENYELQRQYDLLTTYNQSLFGGRK